MRGVVLAGGTGSRLGELTKVTNKHLLPVGELPMIYYPLKKLIGVGIREIILITGRNHMGSFVDLLGSGRDLGCSLTYRVQDEAGGIAQALGLCESFVGSERCCVILGDNVFRDPIPIYLIPEPDSYPGSSVQAWIFLKDVPDPTRYGVAAIDTVTKNFVEEIVEKPAAISLTDQTHKYLAVIGIYVYPPDVFSVIKTLRPSRRGELEITDVNNHYLRQDRLNWCMLNQWWTDAGTFESLAQANKMVREEPPMW